VINQRNLERKKNMKTECEREIEKTSEAEKRRAKALG